MSATTLEMTPEKEQMLDNYQRELERIESEAPRYDVEYYIDADSDQEAVMAAHEALRQSLQGFDYVTVTTTSNQESAPEDRFGVMITVAAEVRKHSFESAEAVYLADSGNKHCLWCLTDYEIPEEPTDSFEDSEYESFEEVEMEFLR